MKIDPELGTLFREAFTPLDFPIASAQSALEKFNFHLPPAGRIVPLEDAPSRAPATRPGRGGAGSVAGAPRLDDSPLHVPTLADPRLECVAACNAKLWACRRGADPSDRGSHRGLAKCIAEVIVCTRRCG